MAEWFIEIRKHAIFTASTLLLMILALGVHLSTHSSLTGAVWVFSVVLLSGAWTVYACWHIFTYVACGKDILLHLSDQVALKKFALKTAPLTVGFGFLGMASIFGYLDGADQDTHLSAVQIAGVFGTKVLSVASLIAWGWVLSRCVRRMSSLGMQVTIYGVAWIVSIIFSSTIVALASDTNPNSWFIGVSDIYQGIPTYINAIPIIIDHAPQTATVASILLNFAAILTAIGCEIFRCLPRTQ